MKTAALVHSYKNCECDFLEGSLSKLDSHPGLSSALRKLDTDYKSNGNKVYRKYI